MTLLRNLQDQTDIRYDATMMTTLIDEILKPSNKRIKNHEGIEEIDFLLVDYKFEMLKDYGYDLKNWRVDVDE